MKPTDFNHGFRSTWRGYVAAAAALAIALPAFADTIETPGETEEPAPTVIGIKTKSLADGSIGLPTEVSVIYDMPEGLYAYCKQVAILYAEGDEANKKNITTKLNADKNGFTFNIRDYAYLPSTTYTLRFCDNYRDWNYAVSAPTNTVKVQDYELEPFSVTWTTPSEEEAGFAPLELTGFSFSRETTADKADYADNAKTPYLGNVYLDGPTEYYVAEGNIECHVNTANSIAKLYEVTPEGDRFMKDCQVLYGSKYDAHVSVYANMYEGRKYKVVVPEKSFYVTENTKSATTGMESETSVTYLRNYVYSKEPFVFTFEGTQPIVKLQPTGCNHEDGEELEYIYNIVWQFDRAIRFASGEPTAEIKYKLFNNKFFGGAEMSGTQTLRIEGTKSLVLDKMHYDTGNPFHYTAVDWETYTIPEGTIAAADNDDIVNGEFKITINRLENTGEENPGTTVKVDKVKLNVIVNGSHSLDLNAIKGESVTVKLTPDENWKVTSLKQNGRAVTGFMAADGSYTTSALTADITLEATVGFAGTLVVADEQPSGVALIPDSGVSVSRDGDSILVDGLAEGQEVTVYSLGGHVVAKRNAATGRMRISLDHGVYIVAVNGSAVKIQV